MADWKKLLVENPPASDIASSPSSGKVLKVSSNGTGLEWADDAGGAFQITGSNAHYTAGSVGIGTNSPSYALHTVGDTFTSEKFLILQNKLIQSRNSVGGGNFGNSIKIKNSSTGNMEFTLEHNSYDFVFTNGKVGIGTTNPTAPLTVKSSGTDSAVFLIDASDGIDLLRVDEDSNGNGKFTMRDTAGNADILFHTGASSYINNGQSFGIGTSSPSANTKLDVSGGPIQAPIYNIGGEPFHGEIKYVGTGNIEHHPRASFDINFVMGTNNAFSVSTSSLQNGADGIGNTSKNLGGLPVRIYSNEPSFIIDGHFSADQYWGTRSGGTNEKLMSMQMTNDQKMSWKAWNDNGTVKYDDILLLDGGSSNVGIGTDSPSHPMHINSSVSNGQLMQLHNTNNADGTFIKFTGVNSSSEDWQIGSGTLGYYIYNLTNSSMGLMVSNAGNVGIGTSSPATNLDVNEGAYFNFGSNTRPSTNRTSFQGQVDLYQNSTLRGFFYAGANIQFGTYGNIPLYLMTNNAIRTTITGDGKFGIGTTSPSEKLHVNGNIKAGSTSRVFFNTNATGIGSSTVNQLDVFSFGDMNISTENSSTKINFKPVGTTIGTFTTTGLGIGTSSLSSGAKLHVVGSNSANILKIQGDGSVAGIQITRNGTDFNNISTTTTNLIFATGGSTRMLLNNTGLGIGTSSPQTKLHIATGADTGEYFRGGGSTNSADARVLKITASTTTNVGDTHAINAISATGVLKLQTHNTDRLVATTTGIGIGASSPTEKLQVAGNILLPTDASSVSYRLRLTGDSTSEIYANSYDLYYATALNHYKISNNGLTLRTSDSSRQILLEHSSSNKRIYSTSSDFNMYVGHSGALGFLTSGSTSGYNAIQSVYTDNNTSGLKFNTKASGTDTERMRITSAGLVGIATSNPIGAFSVAPDTDATTTLGRVALHSISSDYATFSHYDQRSSGVGYALRQQANGTTAINSAGTNRLNFNINNSTKMVVKGEDVGIGTTSPTHGKLEVRGVSNDTTIAIHEDAGTHKAQLHLRSGGNDVKLYTSGSDNKFHIDTESVSQAFTILTDGKIGIGNSSPSYALDVTGVGRFKASQTTDQLILRDSTNSTNCSFRSVSGTLFIKPDGSNIRATLTSTGRLGIGTSSPSKILHINDGTYNLQIDGNELFHSDADPFYIKSAGNIQLQPNSTTRFIIDDNSRMSLSNNDNGSSSTLFGQSAGNALTSNAQGNSAFGHESLLSNTDADRNTGFGYQTLRALTTGSNNTAVGYEAVRGDGNGTYTLNTGVGGHSLYAVTSAVANSALGFRAMESLTSGEDNVAIGAYCLDALTDGDRNVAIGKEALTAYTGSGATYQVAVGHRAGYNRTGGVQNVALGAFSQYGATSGTAPTGSGNTSVGYLTLNMITSGQYNSTLGVQAGHSITTSTFNVYSGYQAGYYNETGGQNVAIGSQSQFGASGQSHQNNTSVGYQSLKNVTTGSNNTTVGTQSGDAITSGEQNSLFGHQSGTSIQLGRYNSAVGYQSLNNEQHGSYSTALGYKALYSQVHGSVNGNTGNVGVGYHAGFYNVTGTNNTILGSQALEGSSGNSTSNNVAIGTKALRSLSTGHTNVAIGGFAGDALTTSTDVVAVGYNAIGNATAPTGSIGIGRDAGAGLSTGLYNIAIGHNAMSGGSGADNFAVAIGFETMRYANSGNSVAIGGYALQNSTNDGQVAIGYQAMQDVTSGEHNTAVGYRAGLNMTASGNNTILGYDAFVNAVDGCNSNVAIGNQAMITLDRGDNASTTVNGNIAIGYNALASGDFASLERTFYGNIAIGKNALDATGTNSQTGSIAIGHEALTAATSGQYNTAIGYQSGRNQSTATANTFVGFQSGRSTTGSSNVAVGKYSMYEGAGANNCTAIGTNALQNVTSNDNVAIGTNAMLEHENGTSNTVVGASAMDDSNGHAGYHNSFFGTKSGAGGWTGAAHSNTAIGSFSFGGGAKTATAIYNTTVGRDSLYNLTSGHKNSSLGYRSGLGITQGDENSLFGFQSGTTVTNGRRNTIIGSGSDVSASDALNQIVLGQGQTGVQDNSAIIGNSACADVFMGDNGSAWSTTSDGRLKENIEEWSTGLDAINKLRVVEYNFKEDNPYKYDHKKKRQGIIAQEAIEAIPEMIKDDGEWLTANQEPMIWALVNAVQELTKKVNELETKLNKEN